MTVVLKLGGSVITDKAHERSVDHAALDRVAAAISDRRDPALVLVLGGGSFGHPPADRHGLSTAVGTSDAAAVAEVHDAMLAFVGLVVDRLVDEGVPAMAFHPLSMGVRRGGSPRLQLDAVSAALEAGFVPVVHGDGIVTADDGVTIVSGDEIVVTATRALEADRVGLCTGVSGVLDADGAVVEHVADYEAVADLFEGPDGVDVTGGMAAKVRRLLDLDRPAAIFGIEGVSRFLAGEQPGTTVAGER